MTIVSDLQAVLTDAGIPNIANQRSTSYGDGRARVVIDSYSVDQPLRMTVLVMVSAGKPLDELAEKAWLAIADTQHYQPVGMDMSYGSSPFPGSDTPADYASIDVVSSRRFNDA